VRPPHIWISYLLLILVFICSNISGEDRARGILKGYIEDSDLVKEKGPGRPKSDFDYEKEVEFRSPDGFFDFVLQAFVDFGSKDFGAEDTLETKKDFFESYVKKQQLTSSDFSGRLLQVYGYELDDPYEKGPNFGSSSTELGSALGSFFELLDDYGGKENSYNPVKYTEGLTEGQIDKAIENAYRQ